MFIKPLLHFLRQSTRSTHKWRAVILLPLLVGMVLSGMQWTRGQSAQVDVGTLPRVISSSPALREVVLPGTPIQLLFSDPMDRASVESALSLTPGAPGKVEWADDTTLKYTPAAPLKRGETYTLTLTTAAKSKAGTALGDPYHLTFSVTGNLGVNQAIPAPDAQNVEAQSTITVVFDRPVVPLMTTTDQASLPQPLTLTPAVDGKGQWVGTAIYVFKPTKALAGGTLYTATVSGDLKDVDGNPIDQAYHWSFKTIPPQILSFSPQAGQQQVLLDEPIQVQFNQPMDQASVRQTFTLRNAANGADVAGTLTFNADGTAFTFKPASRLELSSFYQASLQAGARSASGDATLTNPTTVVFGTVPYPRVIQVNPPKGARVAPGGGLSVQYSTQMDAKSFADRVHVDPKPDNLSISPSGNSLYIGFQSLPATTYILTIDAGVADIYGNPIKEPFTTNFSTTDAEASMYLVVRDQAAFTSAYKPNTSILLGSINVTTVEARLAAINAQDIISYSARNSGYLNLYQFNPASFTREWKQTLQAKPNVATISELLLAGDQGGKLKPGLYYLDGNSPDINRLTSPREPFRQLLIVASASLTFKVGPDEVLVWATDLQSGQPVASAKVDIYDWNGKSVASGPTDASGLFRARINAANPNNQPYWAVLTGDGLYSFGSSQWMVNQSVYYGGGPVQRGGPNEPPINYDMTPRHDVVYLYTDQPVYRPAHPVYFRGIVRNQDDVTFNVPAGQPLHVTISDQDGKEVYKQDLTLNGYGAFNGKYEPPQDAPLGSYNIRATYQGQDYYLNFQVAEFRPPEFQVNVTANADRAAAGDTIKVAIDSTFFFGGPVSGGSLTWTAVANQGYFAYLGDEPFDFYPFQGPYVYNRQVASGSGQLDDKGHFTIEVPADLGDNPVTQVFTIEATVTDINNQPISGRTSVTVFPATILVGLQPAGYVGQAGKPMDVKVALVDWDSKPQPNQTVNMVVTERRWQQDPKTLQWSQQSIPVTDGKVTTDDKGKAVFTFTPPRAGIYQIEGTARDSRERIARTVSTLWVQGPDAINWTQGDKTIPLVADKKSYKPGDTASILIASPFKEPVQALVTVERAGIMKAELMTIAGSATYKLPLDVVHAPNVYVAVAIMHGSGTPEGLPDLRFGVVNLDVAVTQQLKINLKPSTDKAKPGDTVTFDVVTTDLDGKPVAAEVGLSLADLANLSVGYANSGPLFDFFWHSRGLSILTSTPMTKLIDDLTTDDIKKRLLEQRREALATAGGAAPAPTMAAAQSAPAQPPAAAENAGVLADGFAKSDKAAAPTPRTNFVDTPLWLPDLGTDANGHGTASVTLPDNLTTWRLDARAISKDTFVGENTLDVISTKPLLVRPSTPRFFVVGDETELAVVVNNNTDQDLPVQVGLDAKGVTIKGDTQQTVNVPKAGRVRVTWNATVGDVDNVDLSFSAVSGQYSDASKPAVGLGDQRLLPVYRYLAPDYVSTAGTLTASGKRTEAVSVPSATLAPTGNLTIRLNPSLAATTLDGLDYLKNYPYQCIEQTVSRFLPNVITYRALQKLHLDKPELRANLETAVNYALARLQREQHGDGGWGWFPNDESNPLTTTYALLGLTEARASDLPVDQDMINRATSYVMSTLKQVNDNTPVYDMNRTAFTLYVLAKANNPNVSLMDSLFARREKMNLFARAFLAQSYALIKGDAAKTTTLLSDLQTAAVVSATGTHWEEKYRDWWNWDSDTRTTAIVLQTLVMLQPQSQLIPNVVRWLMVARRGDAWETTQETAWAVMALTNWMDVSGELKADYAYTVALNDKPVGDGKANADTLRDTKTLQIAVADMLRGQINKIVIDHGEGPGALYYTATLTVNQPVEAIKPTDRGFAFTRTYYLGDKPVTSAQVGDTINVVVEITANSDMYYVNIEDPIPAGTELVDTSLKTTGQVTGQRPALQPDDVYRHGWGWWWFSNTELRTEKIVLSATYLPRGSYRFVYQIRASSAGTYRVIPTNGQEFYFPEVFGRGAGSLFTVTP